MYHEGLLRIDDALRPLWSRVAARPSLPPVNRPAPPADRRAPRELLGETPYGVAALRDTAAASLPTITVGQRAVYDVSLSYINGGRVSFAFFDGPGGTGEGYLYNALLASVRSEGRVAVAVASSDIAALLFPGRRTAHSRFKILVKIDESSFCFSSKQ